MYLLVGGVEAIVAGSFVGLMYAGSCLRSLMWKLANSSFSIGAVFKAGYFNISTWIPLVWGVTNTLILILSSFAIQGGL